MELLTMAQLYAEARGDGERFSRWYGYYRQKFGVRYSVRLTLAWIYGDAIAEELRVFSYSS